MDTTKPQKRNLIVHLTIVLDDVGIADIQPTIDDWANRRISEIIGNDARYLIHHAVLMNNGHCPQCGWDSNKYDFEPLSTTLDSEGNVTELRWCYACGTSFEVKK